MSVLRLAAAQTVPHAGDVAANLADHLRLIDRAAAANADLIVFPELSLSGYEPDHAAKCVLHPDDDATGALKAKAQATGILVLAGTPVASRDDRNPCIGMAVLSPDGGLAVYRKFFLHPGEERFAAPGTGHPFIGDLKGEAFACAICADTMHCEHPAAAAEAGATLYLVGAFLPPNSYQKDSEDLRTYATRHDMAVLMANYGGPSGGFDAAGRSAFWAPGGRLIVEAPASGESLILAVREDTGWRGEIVGE